MKELTDREFLLLVRDRLVLFDGYSPNEATVKRLERMAESLPVYSNVDSKRRGW